MEGFLYKVNFTFGAQGCAILSKLQDKGIPCPWPKSENSSRGAHQGSVMPKDIRVKGVPFPRVIFGLKSSYTLNRTLISYLKHLGRLWDRENIIGRHQLGF